VTSSRSSLSQLSCKVPISRARRSRCSSVSPATHFSLFHFRDAGAGDEDGVREVVVFVVVPVTLREGETAVVSVVDFAVEGEDETVLGGPKKEVMLAFTLGFLGSLVGRVAALRLRDMVRVRWRIRRDSLVVLKKRSQDVRRVFLSFKRDRVN